MSKATGKQIREAVEYWRLALGLEDWAYTIQIGAMPNGDYGSAEVNVPYKRVHFRFSPKGMAAMGETVDGMAVHEWCHTLTESLAAHGLRLAKSDRDKEAVGDAEEALTTELERLVLRLHRRAKP